MTKELKEKLEKGLLDAKLDKGLLAFVNIEKEEEIQGVIDNLLKLKTPQPPVEEMLRDAKIQSEIDRRISEAKKKWDEANKPNPSQEPENKGGLTAEMVAQIVAQEVSKATEPLTGKLGEFEKNKAREEKISQLRKLLSSSEIPEALRESRIKYFNPDSEVQLDEWVKQQEQEHQSYKQALIDSGSISGAPEKGYKAHDEMTEAEAQAIVDRANV